MNDQDEKIRRLLKSMADEVPPHHTVPRSVTRRARTRIAMNSVAIGTLVVALGIGAFAGVRALTPASKPTKAPLLSGSSSPPPAATPACTSGQLRAVGSLSGAAGSRVGGITLMDYSDKACTLSGRPVIKLYDSSGHEITSGVSFTASVAQWQADASPKPSGWPVVTLDGAKSSFVRIGWSNWCLLKGAAPLWRVVIPGSGTVDVINGMGELGPPPCNGPGMPSTIQVGPFEPGHN
ncbi:MAG TPA: DUF4232 domain-containing protein [Actinomycetota bacterium]|nr:DUF4232 domain-containing protein [Actinomycetota bacterium]